MLCGVMLLGILPALRAIEDDGLDWVVDEYTARTPLDELMEAAENGNADAQYKLWLMYYNGDTVPKNYAEALKWFRVQRRSRDIEKHSVELDTCITRA